MEKKNGLIDEILKNGPSESTLHLVLAHIKDEGRLNETVQWCLKFLRVYPRDVFLRRLLAETYLDMGLIGQAETEFQKLLSMMDDFVAVHAKLAEIYEREKRYEEAGVQAAIFLTHHPKDAGMRELLERVESHGDAATDAAEDSDGDQFALPEADESSLVDFATPTIAELYYKQGQLDAAVETYERVVAEHPEDSTSAKRLSELKESLEGEVPGGGENVENARTEDEKLLAVLEAWLPRVGEIRYG